MGLDERFEMKMAKRRGEECGGNRLFKFVQGEGRGTGRVSRGFGALEIQRVRQHICMNADRRGNL